MTRYQAITALVLSALLAMPAISWAQPNRQMPGSRVFLPGSPIQPTPVPNSRIRPAASSTGVESTDFYPKNGYPKILGDAIEQGSASGGAGGAAGGNGGGAGGNTGVQSAGSGGFQGNTGNQIGTNGGTTVLGNLFGVRENQAGGLNFGNNNTMSNGLTGGGFSGMVPKGFGFGGTPDLNRKWYAPLHGTTNK